MRVREDHRHRPLELLVHHLELHPEGQVREPVVPQDLQVRGRMLRQPVVAAHALHGDIHGHALGARHPRSGRLREEAAGAGG
ncbi:MAG: hypothetical protein IT372_31510 [Polyangiaceae bacterium]|nr:hypothetical protein [Polyangiaceae bacterium]